MNRKSLSTICLVIATLFCPIGYDALFSFTMELVGSYWLADIIFYIISMFFFSLYCIIGNLNPIDMLKSKIIEIKNKIKKQNL